MESAISRTHNHPNLSIQLSENRERRPSRIPRLLLSLLLLLSQSVAQEHPQVDDQSALLSFNELTVRAMSRYEDLLAVAVDGSLIIYEVQTSDNGSIALGKKQQLDLPAADENSLPLLEFKLVFRNVLFFCNRLACRVCKFGEAVHNACVNYPLEGISSNVQAIKGSVVGNGRLIVRSVSGRTASISALDTGASRPTNTMADHAGVTDIAVVASFSNDQHTFFVGSARKVDIPLSLIFSGERKRHYRYDIRMSRVCNFDATTNFESRIDIALSCQGLEESYFRAIPHKAVAASLSVDKTRLFVVIQNGTVPLVNNVICEYNLAELLKTFEDTWNTCQAITDASAVKAKCEAYSYAPDMADKQCFLFTWQAKVKLPICEKFNKDSSNKTLDNCQLASSTINANRNGWLENFYPVMGDVVARFENGSSDVVDVLESFEKNALFVSFASGLIERLPKRNTSAQPLWSVNTTATTRSMSLQLNQKTKTLFYLDGNKVKYIRAACAELYPTCEKISWDDPLKCGWCAERNGTGRTVSLLAQSACPAGQIISRICPPWISEVSIEKDKYTIFGENFNNVRNLNVATCGQKCQIVHQTNTVVRCLFSTQPLCDIVLAGALGDNNNFSVAYFNHLAKIPDDSNAEDQEPRNSHTRMFRIVAFIFVFVFLLAMVVLIWQLYRKYYKRLRKINKKIINKEKNQNNRTYKTVVSDPKFVDSWAEDGQGEFSVGQLDKLRIRMIKYIGDGSSSRVHLAEYDFGSKGKQLVAVKTVNNASFELKDITREIELISQCSHFNIVEYIGHYTDKFGIHIVTEYMAGGDLHEFLINEDNKPTIGDAFCYSLQICEGMEYLTKQHIIHRDLAARNCMLDAAHAAVKITDFGLCRTSNDDYEYVSENNQQKLPFRWTAIECFGNNSKFSDKSDVWSFGVVVWEIFARSMQPYEGLDSKGVRDYLMQGARLKSIPFCPDELYQNVMLRCWNLLPSNRPSFSLLKSEIENIFYSLKADAPEYISTEYETPISSANSPHNTNVVTTPV